MTFRVMILLVPLSDRTGQFSKLICVFVSFRSRNVLLKLVNILKFNNCSLMQLFD
jgi:hypothetical protein